MDAALAEHLCAEDVLEARLHELRGLAAAQTLEHPRELPLQLRHHLATPQHALCVAAASLRAW